jgi:hypothetical protein
VQATEVHPLRVLGIDVDDVLLERWRGWLAPEVQPFFVESNASKPWELAPEIRDTYKAWRIDRGLEVVWLDEPSFLGLPRSERAGLVRSQVACGRGAVPTVRAWSDLLGAGALRSQADGHRFVWWPSLITPENASAILRRFIEETRLLPSRHGEVRTSTWKACAELLPGVRRLAGTFPRASGPNCFGTVLAAAGVEDADEEWVVVEPFVEWLEGCTLPGGDDQQLGTVLVWRDHDAQPVHAAVTIGDGWAFEKPSQEWSTPRSVLRVDELIRANRTPGQRIERHRLHRGG